jgi:bifunctional DNase/RNase
MVRSCSETRRVCKPNRILIKDFEHGPRYLVLKCALVIEQLDKVHNVAIKASDAFALAIETKSPIVIRQELIERLPIFSPATNGGLYLSTAK